MYTIYHYKVFTHLKSRLIQNTHALTETKLQNTNYNVIEKPKVTQKYSAIKTTTQNNFYLVIPGVVI